MCLQSQRIFSAKAFKNLNQQNPGECFPALGVEVNECQLSKVKERNEMRVSLLGNTSDFMF